MAKFSELNNEQNLRNKNFKEMRRRMWEKSHQNWDETEPKIDWGVTETGKSPEFHGTGPGHFGKGPKNWIRSDERIREEVCEALYESYDVDATDIEVLVAEGVVTLKGTVNSRFAKKEAEDCIDFLRGVKDVRNELKVRPIRPGGGMVNPGFETGFS